MENKLKDAFDSLHMPQSCADRIEKKLCKPKTDRKEYSAEPVRWEVDGWVKGVAAAAAMIAVLAVGILLLPGSDQTAVDPTEQTEPSTDERGEILNENGEMLVGEQEMEELRGELERLRPGLELAEAQPNMVPAELLTLLTSDSQADVMAGLKLLQDAKADILDDLVYVENDITYTYRWKDNTLQVHEALNTTPYTPWFMENGKSREFVGFIANDEYIDITHLISEEEPFVYIYTDRYYITHYIAIGRTKDGIGYLECRKFCLETEEGEWDLGGISSDLWNSETDSCYGWAERAREILEPYGVQWSFEQWSFKQHGIARR